MKIFIENLANSTEKQECVDGTWKVWGHVAVPYPYPYGYIPNTMQQDNDPLDAFLITQQTHQRGDTVDVEIIGMLEFIDNGEVDDKILCAPKGSTLTLTKETKDKITFFVQNAFRDIPNKKVSIGEFKSAEKALEVISSCRSSS